LRQQQTILKVNIAEPNVMPKLKVDKTCGSRPTGAIAMRNSKKPDSDASQPGS
jgi:hypothetical protein